MSNQKQIETIRQGYAENGDKDYKKDAKHVSKVERENERKRKEEANQDVGNPLAHLIQGFADIDEIREQKGESNNPKNE